MYWPMMTQEMKNASVPAEVALTETYMISFHASPANI